MSPRALLANRRAAVGAAILGFFVLVALLAPYIAPHSPTGWDYDPALPMSAKHLLGTNTNGQDIFSQLVWGTRLSLTVGFLSGAVICLVQLVMGVFSGYVGGWIDTGLSTVTNVFLVLPGLPLLIILAAYVKNAGTIVLVAVITITGWAWGARVLRSQAIALRDRPFVEAARISGESRWHIVVAHIVPNMLGIMTANFFGAALFAILAEAGLEFIGLGDPSAVTWGTMLYWAQQIQAPLQGMWVWLLAPGACILLVGTALGLLNFAIDEIANPNLRRN